MWQPPGSPSVAPSSPYRLPLLRVLLTHPLFFWVSIVSFLVFITGMAFSGLINPNFSKPVDVPRSLPESAGSSIVHYPTDAPPTVNADQGGVPIWSFGAIAFACAGGSMLISKRLFAVASPRKSLKLSRADSVLQMQVDREDIGQNALLLNSSTLKTVNRTAARNPSATPEEPLVTVVPVDQSMPLDWEESSLADLMDIRYRVL
jgi:hypothetical protein